MKTYKLQFCTFDRVSIPNILPQIGKYETGIVIRDLIGKLQLSQIEIVQLKFKQEPGGGPGQVFTTWDATKDRSRGFILTELEFNLIKKSLADLNAQEKLQMQPLWLTLYEKFQDAKPEDNKPTKEK
jgi:hypothetical protein